MNEKRAEQLHPSTRVECLAMRLYTYRGTKMTAEPRPVWRSEDGQGPKGNIGGISVEVGRIEKLPEREHPTPHLPSKLHPKLQPLYLPGQWTLATRSPLWSAGLELPACLDSCPLHILPHRERGEQLL